jgi:hypothetical protein
MNTPNVRSRVISPALAGAGSRAALSPLLRRATLDALARSGAASRTARARSAAVPPAASLSPVSPAATTPLDWWDPHLLDRLQAPLSRIRE